LLYVCGVTLQHMISLILTGNLGKDCETKQIEGGRTMIRFSVACKSYGDNTTWVSVTMFKPSDKDGIAQYLKQGTKVFVRGIPEATSWTDNQGNARADLQVVSNEVELLGSKS